MKQEEWGKRRSNSNEGKSLIREENNYLIWLRSSNTVLIRETLKGGAGIVISKELVILEEE